MYYCSRIPNNPCFSPDVDIWGEPPVLLRSLRRTYSPSRVRTRKLILLDLESSSEPSDHLVDHGEKHANKLVRFAYKTLQL